jgi:hypothetical protein
MLENSTWLFGMQVFFKKKWLSLKKGLNYYHFSLLVVKFVLFVAKFLYYSMLYCNGKDA